MQWAAMQPSIALLIDAVNSLVSSQLSDGKLIVPIRVADLGASQGANSMQPCKAIIEAIRSRCLELRPAGAPPIEVEVVHEDLPSNDWSSLLSLVNDPETSYVPKVIHGRNGTTVCPLEEATATCWGASLVTMTR